MPSYGTYHSTSFSREISNDTPMEPGKIYHAEMNVVGYRTLLPGWEDEAMFQIRDAAYQKNCEITYIEIDSQNMTAVIQSRLMDTGNATAMIEPITMILLIAFVGSIVIAIYAISLIINGGVKELSGTMVNNPVITPVVYGALAIVGIALFIYLRRQ